MKTTVTITVKLNNIEIAHLTLHEPSVPDFKGWEEGHFMSRVNELMDVLRHMYAPEAKATMDWTIKENAPYGTRTAA